MSKIISFKRRTIYKKINTKKTPSVEVLSETQLAAIEKIEDARDRAIIKLLLSTGLRAGELVDLSYGDVFRSIKERVVVDMLVIVGKGNKQRKIPLNQTAKACILELDRYNKSRLGIARLNKAYPIVITRNRTRMSVQSLNKITRKYLGTHVHILRKTFLTQLFRKNVSPKVVQVLAGHSSFETTAKFYLSVSSQDMKTAVDMLVV